MKLEFGGHMIRNYCMADAPSLAKYANNPKIACNLRDSFPHPYHMDDAQQWLARVVETDSRTVFAIATSHEVIGSIGLAPGEDIHRFTAEMGYWLAEPFWGKGIMTQAVKAMTDYGISVLKLNRIHADPFTTNPASARVLEKAGFTREGTIRASVFKNGKILDQYIYAYIAPEIRTGTGFQST